MKITRSQLKQLIKEEILREQQTPQEGLSDDGKSFTGKFEIAGDIQLAMTHADIAARAGAEENNLGPGDISGRSQYGGWFYSTFTAR